MANNNNNNTATVDNETIAALRRELEARDESIFDLEATLITVEAEKQYSIENTQREAAQRVRQLQEELRRAQHEANLARRRTAATTTTNNTDATATNHTRLMMRSPPLPVTAAVTPRVAPPHCPPQQQHMRRSSAERLLDHLRHYEAWNGRVSFQLAQHLQACTTEVQVLWLVLTSQQLQPSVSSYYQLLAMVLEHSPTACSFLAYGGPQEQRPEQQETQDLLHPLWEPGDGSTSGAERTIPTTLQQQQMSTWFDTIYRIALQETNEAAIDALRILDKLVQETRCYSYTLPEEFLDSTLLPAWIGSLQATLQQQNRTRRLLKFPVEPSQERSSAWMNQVSRVLRHSIWRRKDDVHHRRWLATGRLATVLATLLDWFERMASTDGGDEYLSHYEAIFWLHDMASHAYDWLLRMQMVTDRSTTEHWHRAPTAVTVVLRYVCQIQHTQQQERRVLEALVDFFHGILLGIQHNRRLQQQQQQVTTTSKRQQPCLSFWDVLHPHADAFASCILEPLQADPRLSADIQAKLQLQMEELEEDRAERFGDSMAEQ